MVHITTFPGVLAKSSWGSEPGIGYTLGPKQGIHWEVISKRYPLSSTHWHTFPRKFMKSEGVFKLRDGFQFCAKMNIWLNLFLPLPCRFPIMFSFKYLIFKAPCMLLLLKSSFWNSLRFPDVLMVKGGGAHLMGKSQGHSSAYSAFSKWLKNTLDTHSLSRDQAIIKSRKPCWRWSPQVLDLLFVLAIAHSSGLFVASTGRAS